MNPAQCVIYTGNGATAQLIEYNLQLLSRNDPCLYTQLFQEALYPSDEPVFLHRNAGVSFFLKNIFLLNADHIMPPFVRHLILSRSIPIFSLPELLAPDDETQSESTIFSPYSTASSAASDACEELALSETAESIVEKLLSNPDALSQALNENSLDSEEGGSHMLSLRQLLIRMAVLTNNTPVLDAIFPTTRLEDIGNAFLWVAEDFEGDQGAKYLFSKLTTDQIRELLLIHVLPDVHDWSLVLGIDSFRAAFTEVELAAMSKKMYTSTLLIDQFAYQIRSPEHIDQATAVFYDEKKLPILQQDKILNLLLDLPPSISRSKLALHFYAAFPRRPVEPNNLFAFFLSHPKDTPKPVLHIEEKLISRIHHIANQKQWPLFNALFLIFGPLIGNQEGISKLFSEIPHVPHYLQEGMFKVWKNPTPEKT